MVTKTSQVFLEHLCYMHSYFAPCPWLRNMSCATGRPLVVTFKKSKVEEEVTFDGIPSWDALGRKVEELYRELEAEKFRLKAGKLELSEANWVGYAASNPSMTLGVSGLLMP